MKTIVIYAEDGEHKIDVSIDRDELAHRYAKLVWLCAQMVAAGGDPDVDYVSRVQEAFNENLRTAFSVLRARLGSLTEQFGTDGGIERAVMRRHIDDLESFLGIVARASEAGDSIEMADDGTTFGLTTGGIKIAFDRFKEAKLRGSFKVRQDMLANDDPLPVAE